MKKILIFLLIILNCSIFAEKEPKIISLSPAVTEKLFAIGAGNMIVGRTIYCNYPEEAKSINSIGNMFEPKVELILQKQPDLVIAETHFNKKILNLLEQAGIKCVVRKSPKTLEEIYTDIISLGELTSHTNEAKKLVISLKKNVANIQEQLKNSNTYPKVYFILGSGKNEFTAGKDTFISEMIAKAGGNNIANDVTGWNYNAEKLVINNPEIVFGSKQYVDLFVKKYPEIDAVKNNKYYYIDSNLLTLPGPRAINEGIKGLFDIFYQN